MLFYGKFIKKQYICSKIASLYDTKQYNTTTTPNLKGKDSVQVPLNGFYKVYVENGTLVCEVENGATPPPLALEIISGEQCLTYTVGGTIQGTLIN